MPPKTITKTPSPFPQAYHKALANALPPDSAFLYAAKKHLLHSFNQKDTSQKNAAQPDRLALDALASSMLSVYKEARKRGRSHDGAWGEVVEWVEKEGSSKGRNEDGGRGGRGRDAFDMSDLLNDLPGFPHPHGGSHAHSNARGHGYTPAFHDIHHSAGGARGPGGETLIIEEHVEFIARPYVPLRVFPGVYCATRRVEVRQPERCIYDEARGGNRAGGRAEFEEFDGHAHGRRGGSGMAEEHFTSHRDAPPAPRGRSGGGVYDEYFEGGGTAGRGYAYSAYATAGREGQAHARGQGGYKTETRFPGSSDYTSSSRPRPQPFPSSSSRPSPRPHPSSRPPPGPPRDFTDLYAILSLPRTATSAQIKKAYRQLSLENHPDRVTGGEVAKKEATEKMAQINLANEVLADEKRRAVYDRLGWVPTDEDLIKFR